MKKLDGYHKCLSEQVFILEKILNENKELISILMVLEKSGLDYWYVGAGAINQTVFNYYHGNEINYGIKDYDIVYYDSDLSYEKEDFVIKKLCGELGDLAYIVDIKNEARVHLWYNRKYHTTREPYFSVEDAISSWGATITCVGVRLVNGKLEVYAPYGLDDIFGMIIRPVKREFSKEMYDERAKRWMRKWPKLKKIEW